MMGGSKNQGFHDSPGEVEGLEDKYGKPRELSLEVEMGDREFHGLEESISRGRRQDATLFILIGDKIAVIQKHTHAPGIYRAPSGTIKPVESIEECALREAYEETGLNIML